MMEEKDAIANDNLVPDSISDSYPPEPSKPLDSECCGTGCTPCVFDIYEKQLSQWKLQCNAIRRGDTYEKPMSDNQFLTPEEYKALKLLNIFKETETMKVFRFSWPENDCSREFPVKLGQHLLIKCAGVSRQYSILRTDSDLCSFDILIKIYPPPTRLENRKMLTPILDKLVEGEEILARGPFGNVFDYNPKICSNLIFIAAGTGIAPMCRIIEAILSNEEDETRIKLLFSCRKVQDIPLCNQFKQWSSFWNFDIIYFIPSYDDKDHQSVSALPYYGMKIVKHRLNLDHLKQEILMKSGFKLESSIFVICGTKSFEKDVINHLSKIGVDSSKMILF